MIHNDTIIALASPSGMGAISVIRLSGEKAIELVNEVQADSESECPLPTRAHCGYCLYCLSDNLGHTDQSCRTRC